MRHHFGDLLDREGGYWTVVPNRERYAYRIGDVPAGSPEITIVTIGKGDVNWSRALTLPNLEELTLHEPTPEQLLAVRGLRTVKRLRITHARPRNLDFIGSMDGIEELVLEYVSGFNDLGPLQGLKRLRALHIENLRRVSDFSGLAGVTNLKYLAVYGTTDWKQPIADFEFLRGLPQLEVLAMWEVICRAPYPAFLPALSLGNLKKVRVHGSYFATEEYALLEEGLKGVEGTDWGPYRTVAYSHPELPHDDVRAHLPEEVIRSNHPEVTVRYDGRRTIEDPDSRWIEFTGKAARRFKASSADVEAKCRAQSERYSSMKEEARALISSRQAG
ncbi:leucine-rich repeat domain-containing protein [Luteolibacter sp. Populi]|uniref:leucine-rich repeat domain-containing protein n=1 Tax=Luteolibacter sp. Populi TaxID=3230487 RepID=UPI00346668F9